MRRDASSIFAIRVNNFFLFVLLLAAGNFAADQRPRSAYPFLLLIGFLLLFPLSSDPLSKIPAARRALWPLDRRTLIALRLASIALSPMFWLGIALLVRASLGVALAYAALAAAIQGAHAIRRRAPGGHGLSNHIPRLPGVFQVKLGAIFTATLRQILSTLDAYLAILLALAGWIYRFLTASPDPAAFPILSILIGLAISTFAQSLFGLDSRSAWTRFHLLPVSMKAIVLSKDIALLSFVLFLTIPLSPIAGVAFTACSLAIGHAGAAKRLGLLARWRFASGSVLLGGLQFTIGTALALAAAERSMMFALLPIAGSILSSSFSVTHRE